MKVFLLLLFFVIMNFELISITYIFTISISKTILESFFWFKKIKHDSKIFKIVNMSNTNYDINVYENEDLKEVYKTEGGFLFINIFIFIYFTFNYNTYDNN